MEEDLWAKLSQLIDENFALKIIDKNFVLKPIDKDFALKLIDKMIEWDKRVIRPGREVSDEDLRVLYDIYDYFFFAALKAELKDIDNYLHPLFGYLLSRVHHKHKNPYYEGFFNALCQILLLRKLLLTMGDDLWLVQWIQSLQTSLSKLGL
jgi:hypothetical protein